MRGKWAWVGGWSWVLAACGAPSGAPEPPAALTLLHTSDVHSRLWPFRDRISRTDAELGLGTMGELAEVGGAARLATLLSGERRRGADDRGGKCTKGRNAHGECLRYCVE